MQQQPSLFNAIIQAIIASIIYSLSHYHIAEILTPYCAILCILPLPMLSALIYQHPHKAFFLGFIFGFIHFLSTLYWFFYPLSSDLDQYLWVIPFAVLGIPAILACFIGLTCSFTINIWLWLIEKKSHNIKHIIKVLGRSNHLIQDAPASPWSSILYSALFAALWTIFEVLRCYLILPFPWNILSYSIVDLTYVAHNIYHFGVHGMSFIICFTISWPYIHSQVFKQKDLKPFALCVLFFILSWSYGFYAIEIADSKRSLFHQQPSHLQHTIPIQIKVIQHNFPSNTQPDSMTKIQEKIESLLKLSKEKTPQSQDKVGEITPYSRSTSQKIGDNINITPISHTAPLTIIIWPESAIPVLLPKDITFVPIFNQLLDNRTLLITGCDTYTTKKIKNKTVAIQEDENFNIQSNKLKYYNSILFIAKVQDEAQILYQYDKIALVPFGEYTPFAQVFGQYIPILTNMHDFSSGKFTKFRHTNPQAIKQSAKNNPSLHKIISVLVRKIAPYICSEITLSSLVFNNTNTHSELIINLTNDSWFGPSLAPYQHLAITRVRAIELGIPIIRAANTGISAFIDKYGRILARSNLMKQSIIQTKIYM